MTNECSQSPLVEALRDGRLGAQERASMERHVIGCAECRALSRDLDRIGETMRAPESPLTPLEHQRARRALLARAMNVSTRGRKDVGPTGMRRALSFALVAAMMLVAIGSTWALTRATAATATSVLAMRLRVLPRVPVIDDTTIHASRGARFEHTTDAGLETLKLTSGELDVHVKPLAKGDRFLVHTTDADIEVKGTAFQIAAEDGRIRSVAVHEGSVEVRYAGFTAIIPSGGSWRANDEAKVAATTPSAEPVREAAKEPARSARVAMISKAEVAKQEVPPPPVLPKVDEPKVPERSPASLAFANAMSALAVGDNAGAASRFQSFSSAFPSDPRADEADYLRAIALQRAGNGKDAAAAGKHYLTERPNGAHRVETETILAGASPY